MRSLVYDRLDGLGACWSFASFAVWELLDLKIPFLISRFFVLIDLVTLVARESWIQMRCAIICQAHNFVLDGLQVRRTERVFTSSPRPPVTDFASAVDFLEQACEGCWNA